MLLEKETQEKFGYEISSLSVSSHKKIAVKCDYCGKDFEQSRKGNTLGRRKIDKDGCYECRYIKMRDIMLKEHGVASQFQRKEIKEKIVKNNLEKYGTEHWVQTDEFKEKFKETMVEKYGVTHSSQIEGMKNKVKETSLKKYGVDHYTQSDEVKNKVKKTNLERFGAESYLASPEGREKIKESFMEKYGVENPFQAEEVKQKMKETNLQKRGVTHHMKIKEVAQKAVEKGVQTKIKQGKVKIFRQKTIRDWANFTGYSRGRFFTLVKQYGFEQAVKMTPHISYLEQIFRDWFDSIDIKYQKHFKVDNYVADFYLPDHNLIIEVDGIYWHSEAVNKDSLYHLNKKNKYTEFGHTSLFFREDEINDSFDIIKSMVLNKCKKSQRIYARKCEIKNGSTDFLEKNHLMNNGHGSIFSLFYEEEEVCSLQFFRKENKTYEISRFCTKLNTNIVGGFSRLLKKFIDEYNPENIITFMDRRYSGDGQYLLDLGFNYQHVYPSYRWTNTHKTFHWSKYPGNSGYEQGLVKIWDCGQAKYTLRVKT